VLCGASVRVEIGSTKSLFFALAIAAGLHAAGKMALA
jgi:hypothetical protein